MPFRSKLALALVASALAGCAQAPNQDGNVTGSIAPSLSSLTSALPSVSSLVPSFSASTGPRKAERIGTNLYRVYTLDRRIEDRIQRENYALLRAAETARDVGGTHFIVVDADGQTASGPLGLGGQSEPATLIRVLKLAPGAEAPIGAVAADEIIHFFGPTFAQGGKAAPPTSAGAP